MIEVGTLAVLSIPIIRIPKNMWFLLPAPLVWLCLTILYQVLFAVSKNRLRLLFLVSLITGIVSLLLSDSDRYQKFPFAGNISDFFTILTIFFRSSPLRLDAPASRDADSLQT